MEEQKAEQNNKTTITVIGFILGLFCLTASIGINIFTATNYLWGGGTGDVIILFAIPIFILYCVAIAINIVALVYNLKSKTMQKPKRKLHLAIIGLILSLSCLVAIPLCIYQATVKTEEVQRKEVETAQAKKAQELAYETEPTVIEQLQDYSECYMYTDKTRYRSARDMICSYLRYNYSNNWQEPETAEQFTASEYAPEYFQYLFDNISKIIIIHHPEEISRTNMGGSYFIVPHYSCSKEQNDSIISVWYQDSNQYTTEDDKPELICQYYDYHSDTIYSRTQKYEDSSLDIYSSDFQDLYEELLRSLYLRSYGAQDFNYSIPYSPTRDENKWLVYDNTKFIQKFFSAWPENYFAN